MCNYATVDNHCFYTTNICYKRIETSEHASGMIDRRESLQFVQFCSEECPGPSHLAAVRAFVLETVRDEGRRHPDGRLLWLGGRHGPNFRLGQSFGGNLFRRSVVPVEGRVRVGVVHRRVRADVVVQRVGRDAARGYGARRPAVAAPASVEAVVQVGRPLLLTENEGTLL